MLEARKVPNTQSNSSRAVLVPPKTVITFDTGINTVVELKPKPAVPSHRVAARQRNTLAREGSARQDSRAHSAESDTSPAVLHRELSGVSLPGSEKRVKDIPEICMSNVDIGLPDSALQAFMQQSPSQPKFSLMSPQAQQTAKIAKLRAVEEMGRVTERSRITEQQRQQYMQTALSMDAPRLARTVMKEEREAKEEVLNSILGFQRKGEGDNSSNCSNRSMDVWDPEASVSFLTGGELLMLEERKHSRDTHRNSSSSSHSNSNGKHTDSTINQATKESTTTTTAAEEEELDNSMDQTVRVLKQPSSAEKRQDEEDQRFCKAVEEVERVRKRFIQKASLPVLGSRSNVDQLSSASLDIGSDNGSDQGSAVVRPGSAGTTQSNAGSNASNRKGGPGIGARVNDLGLRLRKQASGLFSAVLSRDSDTPSPLSDPASAAATPGAAATATNAGQVKERARRLSLALPDTDTDPATGAPFPVLSPNSRGSPMKYIMPTKRQAQLAAEGEVYTVTNNSLSPKPSRLSAADSPKVKSLRVPTDSAQATTAEQATATTTTSTTHTGISEAISPPAPRLSRKNTRNPPPTTAPAPQPGAGTRASQELVASSIDMLIGSRFNSDRTLDTTEEDQQGQQQEILGSSLVLLQQRLDSAAVASSSYRNVLSSKQSAAALLHANLNNNSNIGTSGSSNKVRSNAAATALATINRPSSGGGNAHRRNSGITTTAPSDNQAGTGQIYSELKTESYDAAVGEGEGGVPMLHTDDSTSTLGDMFAFHTGEGSRSHPTSAEGLAQGFQKTADKDAPVGEVRQEKGRRQPAPFRSSYDTDLIADVSATVVQQHQQQVQAQQQPQKQQQGGGEDNSSTMGDSFFSYSAYLPLSSSGDSSSSSHHASLSSAASALHAHPHTAGVHLQPLPITPREPLGDVLGLLRPDSGSRSGRRPSSGRVNPQLQPLDVSAVRSSQPAVPSAKASETPKDLHYGALRRQTSAEKRKHNNTTTNTTSSIGHFSVDRTAASTGSSGAPQLGLSTYTIDESADQSGATTSASASASKNSGAFANLGQGKINSRFSTTNSSTRAAQLRQNALLLMASPLSEWLSVGTSLQLPASLTQSQQAHTHLAPLVSGSTAQSADSQEPLPAGAQKVRRNSKFTFEELQQADLRLSLAQLPGDTALSARKSPRSSTAHKTGGESLPTLLPSLTSQRPAESLVRSSLYAYTSADSEDAVQNVYRSLNRLNDHFSQYSSSAAVGPSQRVAAVDQEFDDLLAATTTGSAAAALITSAATQERTRDSLSTTDGDGMVPVVDDAQGGQDSETDQQEPFLRRGRPSRHNILVSQSCIDGAHTVTDIQSAPNLSALRRAELAAAADAAAAQAATSPTSTQEGAGTVKGALSPHLTHQERLSQLRPAQSASALYDRKRAAATAAAAINASGVIATAAAATTTAAAVSAPVYPRSTANSSTAASPAAHSYNYTGGFSGMMLAASSSSQGSPLAGLSPSALHTPVTRRPDNSAHPYGQEGGISSSANRSSGETRSSLSMHSSSTTSTVNMHRHSSRAPSQPLLPENRLGSLSVNSSTSTSSTALSGMVETGSPAIDPASRNNSNTASASAPQLPLQQQRLGALAAALDAGDAVGNLMAQMMLGKAVHTASGTTIRSAAAGSQSSGTTIGSAAAGSQSSGPTIRRAAAGSQGSGPTNRGAAAGSQGSGPSIRGVAAGSQSSSSVVDSKGSGQGRNTVLVSDR